MFTFNIKKAMSLCDKISQLYVAVDLQISNATTSRWIKDFSFVEMEK